MKKSFYDKLLGDGKVIGTLYEIDPFHEEKIHFVLKEVGKNKRVLDVGCSEGFLGEELIKKGNKVYGIDIVEKNLSVAKKKGLIVKKVDIDTQDLPFEDGFFDAIVLADFIEHVFDTDEVLRRCAKVLKKNGKIILTTPNIASFGRRIMLLLGISPFTEHSLELPTSGFPSAGHIRYYTVKTLREQLEYDGYKEVKVIANALNLIKFRSVRMGELFPSFGVMLMAVAKKK